MHVRHFVLPVRFVSSRLDNAVHGHVRPMVLRTMTISQNVSVYPRLTKLLPTSSDHDWCKISQ